MRISNIILKSAAALALMAGTAQACPGSPFDLGADITDTALASLPVAADGTVSKRAFIDAVRGPDGETLGLLNRTDGCSLNQVGDVVYHGNIADAMPLPKRTTPAAIRAHVIASGVMFPQTQPIMLSQAATVGAGPSPIYLDPAPAPAPTAPAASVPTVAVTPNPPSVQGQLVDDGQGGWVWQSLDAVVAPVATVAIPAAPVPTYQQYETVELAEPSAPAPTVVAVAPAPVSRAQVRVVHEVVEREVIVPTFVAGADDQARADAAAATQATVALATRISVLEAQEPRVIERVETRTVQQIAGMTTEERTALNKASAGVAKFQGLLDAQDKQVGALADKVSVLVTTNESGQLTLAPGLVQAAANAVAAKLPAIAQIAEATAPLVEVDEAAIATRVTDSLVQANTFATTAQLKQQANKPMFGSFMVAGVPVSHGWSLAILGLLLSALVAWGIRRLKVVENDQVSIVTRLKKDEDEIAATNKRVTEVSEGMTNLGGHVEGSICRSEHIIERVRDAEEHLEALGEVTTGLVKGVRANAARVAAIGDQVAEQCERVARIESRFAYDIRDVAGKTLKQHQLKSMKVGEEFTHIVEVDGEHATFKGCVTGRTPNGKDVVVMIHGVTARPMTSKKALAAVKPFINEHGVPSEDPAVIALPAPREDRAA